MNSNQISNFSLKKYKADLIIMSKPKFTKFKLLYLSSKNSRTNTPIPNLSPKTYKTKEKLRNKTQFILDCCDIKTQKIPEFNSHNKILENMKVKLKLPEIKITKKVLKAVKSQNILTAYRSPKITIKL